MRRIVRFVLLTVAVLTAIPAIVTFFYFAPGNRFQTAYHTLRLGMSRSETDTVFGRNPDYECRFGEYRIAYYSRPLIYGLGTPTIDRNRLPQGEVVHTPAEIPYIYAAAQLMFDGSGRLVVFTQNGETTVIETIHGTIPGDRLDRLNESYFP